MATSKQCWGSVRKKGVGFIRQIAMLVTEPKAGVTPLVKLIETVYLVGYS